MGWLLTSTNCPILLWNWCTISYLVLELEELAACINVPGKWELAQTAFLKWDVFHGWETGALSSSSLVCPKWRGWVWQKSGACGVTNLLEIKAQKWRIWLAEDPSTVSGERKNFQNILFRGSMFFNCLSLSIDYRGNLGGHLSLYCVMKSLD